MKKVRRIVIGKAYEHPHVPLKGLRSHLLKEFQRWTFGPAERTYYIKSGLWRSTVTLRLVLEVGPSRAR